MCTNHTNRRTVGHCLEWPKTNSIQRYVVTYKSKPIKGHIERISLHYLIIVPCMLGQSIRKSFLSNEFCNTALYLPLCRNAYSLSFAVHDHSILASFCGADSCFFVCYYFCFFHFTILEWLFLLYEKKTSCHQHHHHHHHRHYLPAFAVVVVGVIIIISIHKAATKTTTLTPHDLCEALLLLAFGL